MFVKNWIGYISLLSKFRNTTFAGGEISIGIEKKDNFLIRLTKFIDE